MQVLLFGRILSQNSKIIIVENWLSCFAGVYSSIGIIRTPFQPHCNLFLLENWCAEKLEKIKVSKNVVDYLQNYVEESSNALKEETDFVLEEMHQVSQFLVSNSATNNL